MKKRTEQTYKEPLKIKNKNKPKIADQIKPKQQKIKGETPSDDPIVKRSSSHQNKEPQKRITKTKNNIFEKTKKVQTKIIIFLEV